MKLIIILLFAMVTFQSAAQLNGVPNDNAAAFKTTSLKPFCDTISSFHILDTWPTGTTWDGEHLWICGSHLPIIYKYDTSGNVIDSIPSPSFRNGTAGLTFDGVNLWTLAEEQDKIYQLDRTDGRVVSEFKIHLQADGFGLAFKGKYLYATDYNGSQMLKIDTSNGQVIDSIKTAKSFLGIEYIDSAFYGIPVGFDYLHEIDETNGSILDSIPWCIPYPLGLAWDGTHLWNVSSRKTNDGTQRIYKMDVFTSTPKSIRRAQSQNHFGLTVFPNPVIEHGTVGFKVNNDEGVLMELFDFHGRKIRTLVNKIVVAGDHEVSVDVKGLPSGIYFIGLSSDNNVDIYKFAVE